MCLRFADGLAQRTPPLVGHVTLWVGEGSAEASAICRRPGAADTAVSRARDIVGGEGSAEASAICRRPGAAEADRFDFHPE